MLYVSLDWRISSANFYLFFHCPATEFLFWRSNITVVNSSTSRRYAVGGGPGRLSRVHPRRRQLHVDLRGRRGPGQPARGHPNARAPARQVRFRKGTDRIGGCAQAAELGPADAQAAPQGRRELTSQTRDGGAVPTGHRYGNRGRRAKGTRDGVQRQDRRNHRIRPVLRRGVRAGLQALPSHGPETNGDVRQGGRVRPRLERQGQRHRRRLHRRRARVQG